MRARASSSQTYDYLTIFLAFTEIMFGRIDTFFLRCRFCLSKLTEALEKYELIPLLYTNSARIVCTCYYPLEATF